MEIMYRFIPGEIYSRKDVYRIIGVPEDTKGGNWDTGYNEYNSDFFIFANVGVPGRTGHDYGNRFDGHDFYWYAKNRTNLRQPQIQRLLNSKGDVYIFCRTDDKSPFTYFGMGVPKSFQDKTPVQITWEILAETHEPTTSNSNVKINEGALKTIKVNIYERNPIARTICLQHHGFICIACSFDFEKVYGIIGKNFIHVHHKKSLAEIGESYELDPVNDLVPLCPNCHAMIHRKFPAYTVEELIEIIKDTRSVSRFSDQSMGTRRPPN